MDPDEPNLTPLHFLEGIWDGEGVGPYGSYKIASKVERRGRWLLLTSAILDPMSLKATYVSTQVFCHVDGGLILHYYDTAGLFHFEGKQTTQGLRFDWTGGENWKRSQYWSETEDKIKFRYESVFLTDGSELFEGHWTRSQAPLVTEDSAT